MAKVTVLPYAEKSPVLPTIGSLSPGMFCYVRETGSSMFGQVVLRTPTQIVVLWSGEVFNLDAQGMSTYFKDYRVEPLKPGDTIHVVIGK